MKKAMLMVALMFVSSSLAVGDVMTFQNGVNGYEGTADTQLFGNNSSGGELLNYGASTTVAVMGKAWYPSTAAMPGLIAFKDLVGSAANQVPVGATINSVTMTLSGGTGDSYIFAMKMWGEWVEGNSNGVAEDGASCFFYRRYQADGVYTPGVDTWGTAEGATGGPIGADWGRDGDPLVASWNPYVEGSTKTFDLTSYVSGDLSVLDKGLYMYASTDWTTCLFASSENSTLSYRPLLTVDYTAVPEPCSLLLLGGMGALSVLRRRK